MFNRVQVIAGSDSQKVRCGGYIPSVLMENRSKYFSFNRGYLLAV